VDIDFGEEGSADVLTVTDVPPNASRHPASERRSESRL
jgi:hypothetical protein